MANQQELQQHLIAIDMYICHLGKSFEEACEELNINASAQLSLRNILAQEHH
ncbi:MAG: hypothetical protein ACI86X_000190 [Moritella sp.]|jgi:hypothetical protein